MADEADDSTPDSDATSAASSGPGDGSGGAPSPPPDLPSYVVDPLRRQSADRLEAIAAYASELAAHRRDGKHDVEPDADDHARDGDHDVEPDAGDHGTSERGGDAMPSTPVGDDELSSLEARGVSTDPGDYEDVPDAGAYVTVKETKPGYRYYYWQWRDGDSWRNRYIAPVDDG